MQISLSSKTNQSDSLLLIMSNLLSVPLTYRNAFTSIFFNGLNDKDNSFKLDNPLNVLSLSVLNLFRLKSRNSKFLNVSNMKSLNCLSWFSLRTKRLSESWSIVDLANICLSNFSNRFRSRLISTRDKFLKASTSMSTRRLSFKVNTFKLVKCCTKFMALKTRRPLFLKVHKD